MFSVQSTDNDLDASRCLVTTRHAWTYIGHDNHPIPRSIGEYLWWATYGKPWSFSSRWLCIYFCPTNDHSLTNIRNGVVWALRARLPSINFILCQARNALAHGSSGKGEYVAVMKLLKPLIYQHTSHVNRTILNVAIRKILPMSHGYYWRGQLNGTDREFILDAPLKWLAVIIVRDNSDHHSSISWRM